MGHQDRATNNTDGRADHDGVIMDDKLAYIYDANQNPGGAVLDGVPLRDLTAAEFAALPERWQAAVKREPFYAAADAPARIGLSDVPGIGEEIASALSHAGYRTITDVIAASDMELLAISGIGAGRLARVRQALADLEE